MRFVLIHGGLHGAWCWSEVIAALEARGYPAIAIDLPGHGQRALESAQPDAYAQAVVEVLCAGDVLVGHSLGGIAITLAAARAPAMLRRVIYLAAVVPEKDKALAATISMDDANLSGLISLSADGLSYCIKDAEAARALLYHDCTQAIARRAYARLTPQQFAPLVTPAPFSDLALRHIPTTYVRCIQDRCLSTPMAELMAARLGVEPVLFDSSHSPFLSRPTELAKLLIEQTDPSASWRTTQ